MTITALRIEQQEDTRVILAVEYGGKRWEIDVMMDRDSRQNGGGLDVEIRRDDVVCTGCNFGWDSRHENEPQE